MGMTNEEAKEFIVQSVKDNVDIAKVADAIKALEQQSSEDCISREAVIKHICESKECYKDECKGRLYKRCFDLQWIYALPPVTPQPRVGKWIDTGIGKEELYGELFVCSECNEVSFYENYCPNCGSYNGGIEKCQ